MPLILPREPSPAKIGSPRVFTIYGTQKVGKTDICSILPKALMVDLEKGSDYVTCMKIQLENAQQIPTLVAEIAKAGRPYAYGIIDTLDKLEEWAEVEATRKYKQSPIGKNFNGDTILELPMGAGYLYLRREFCKLLELLVNSFPRVILITHLRDKFINIDSKEVASKDLDLTGKIRNIVCNMSDAIAHAYRDKNGKLFLDFRTTELVQCGGRCKHLVGKTVEFANPATIENWKNIYSDL